MQRKHLPMLTDPRLGGTTLCGRWVNMVKIAGPDEDPTCKTCAKNAENH